MTELRLTLTPTRLHDRVILYLNTYKLSALKKKFDSLIFNPFYDVTNDDVLITHLKPYMAVKCIKAIIVPPPTHGLNLNHRYFRSQTSSPNFFFVFGAKLPQTTVLILQNT